MHVTEVDHWETDQRAGNAEARAAARFSIQAFEQCDRLGRQLVLVHRRIRGPAGHG